MTATPHICCAACRYTHATVFDVLFCHVELGMIDPATVDAAPAGSVLAQARDAVDAMHEAQMADERAAEASVERFFEARGYWEARADEAREAMMFA